jgi:hypothetical protein
MKKIFFYLFLITIAAASCKKGQNAQQGPAGDNTLHQVSFTVSGFTQTSKNLSRSLAVNIGSIGQKNLPGALPTYNSVGILYEMIYNSAGNLVKSNTQVQTQASFGTFTDSLASGNYTVVFMESAGFIGYGLNTTTGYIASLQSPYLTDTGSFSSSQLIVTPGTSIQLYEKKMALTVNTTNTSSNITLDRVVGQLEVIITDPIPQNVARISTMVDSIQTSFSLADEGAIGVGNILTTFERDSTLTSAAAGATNFTMGPYYFMQNQPFGVTVTAYDASNNILATVRIPHVVISYNQTTILQGSLFGGGSSSGTSGNATITFDPSWNPTPINVSF